MQIKRFLSISAAVVFSGIGLVSGVFLGWLPALILSLVGIGPFVFVVSGIAGLVGGFAAYVKLCKHYQFWPLEKPSKSWLSSVEDFISKSEDETLYNDLKVATRNIEAELRQNYTAGWRNFNIELDLSSDKSAQETVIPQLSALLNVNITESTEPKENTGLFGWLKPKHQ